MHSLSTFGQRESYKVAISNMWMRERKSFGLEPDIIVDKQVNIDNPVAIPLTSLPFVSAAHQTLDPLGHVEQRKGFEGSTEYSHSIGKAMLTDKSPWLAGHIGRYTEEFSYLGLQQAYGLIEILRTIAKVAT